MPRKDIPEYANLVGDRFVLTFKNIGTNEKKDKARYIAQGRKLNDKAVKVQNITTLRQYSPLLIMSMASIKSLLLFSHDVTQAYLHSEDNLSREIFVLPKKKEFMILGLNEEHILRPLSPINGTCDAGDYWDVTIDRHAKKDLVSKPISGDP
eukprot:gb/GEZJ01006601.1/.p1 GENE.gb/GEZJ01006601.1/~~gb/GEZJ01006601.1/.p1  ORF type:complete len:152 (+),score=15.83 gb/GEZJ01006601.1/:55-510(+)